MCRSEKTRAALKHDQIADIADDEDIQLAVRLLEKSTRWRIDRQTRRDNNMTNQEHTSERFDVKIHTIQYDWAFFAPADWDGETIEVWDGAFEDTLQGKSQTVRYGWVGDTLKVRMEEAPEDIKERVRANAGREQLVGTEIHKDDFQPIRTHLDAAENDGEWKVFSGEIDGELDPDGVDSLCTRLKEIISADAETEEWLDDWFESQKFQSQTSMKDRTEVDEVDPGFFELDKEEIRKVKEKYGIGE